MIGGVTRQDRVARSARPGNLLTRGQILLCKRSRWGNPPSRGPIRDTSNSRKIHFGGGFALLLRACLQGERVTPVKWLP